MPRRRTHLVLLSTPPLFPLDANPPTHPTLSGRTRVSARVTFLVVAYSVCSSMLLILNKVAVTRLPAPSFILLCQLATCAAFVRGMSAAKVVECEPLEKTKAAKFGLIVVGFIGTLFANVTTLRYVPVDTIICFRASTPIVIALIEYAYLRRELPSARSWAALGGVFAGVTAYAAADVHFTPVGYAWLATWYTFAIAEMVWVKKVVDTVAMSTWGRTFYQNALAVPPMALVCLLTGEAAVVAAGGHGTFAWGMVAATCVAGLGMSYFSFALRAAISATSFSVIGNVCKVLTILVNAVLWDQHANATGTAALLLCLAMGALYQQPPMRSERRKDLPPVGAYADAVVAKTAGLV